MHRQRSLRVCRGFGQTFRERDLRMWKYHGTDGTVDLLRGEERYRASRKSFAGILFRENRPEHCAPATRAWSMKFLETILFRRPRLLNLLHSAHLVRPTSQTIEAELRLLEHYSKGARLALEIGSYQGVS